MTYILHGLFVLHDPFEGDRDRTYQKMRTTGNN